MLRSIPIAAIVLFCASPALAHSGDHAHGSFLAGLLHPLHGADHLMAMVTVGLWAALLGGAATWAVPAAFAGTMVLGFAAALAGLSLPFVEPVMLASVVVLGLMVALAAPAGPALGMGIVAFFAFFHGFAHGTEIGGAGVLGYGAGFVMTTLLLHFAGALAGLALMRLLGAAYGQRAGRLAGGSMVAGGLVLALAG